MFEKYDYTFTVYKNGNEKVTVLCPEHGEFNVWPRDHMNGMSGCKQCISEKRKKTLVEKYGVDNYFKRTDLVQESMMKKYGVSNPGLLCDHIDKIKKTNKERYGVEWAAWHPDIAKERYNTNLNRYGVKIPSQNKEVSSKAIETKINNGGFTKSNSSISATKFIMEYVKFKGYSIEQCAFASPEFNFHEWGIYYKGKWRLFDLVVFEPNKRGNKNHIVEILEYHGPFHYTDEDVYNRGNEYAYPWKTNNTTIKESVENDKTKEELALTLTNNYYIMWEKDVNPNEVIAENVRKLEARYPGGNFDPYYSENRKDGDL